MKSSLQHIAIVFSLLDIYAFFFSLHDQADKASIAIGVFLFICNLTALLLKKNRKCLIMKTQLLYVEVMISVRWAVVGRRNDQATTVVRLSRG